MVQIHGKGLGVEGFGGFESLEVQCWVLVVSFGAMFLSNKEQQGCEIETSNLSSLLQASGGSAGQATLNF